MTTTNDFNKIWGNILQCQGEVFHTITGLEFKYEIINNKLCHNRTKYKIPKDSFEKAFGMLPLKKLSQINFLYGYSYIFAVLNDKRIND